MIQPSDLIATATLIGAQLRAEQDESDARGRYSEAIHQQLLQQGFYRILRPRMFGGGARGHAEVRALRRRLRGDGTVALRLGHPRRQSFSRWWTHSAARGRH